jgi:hypothetical protein
VVEPTTPIYRRAWIYVEATSRLPDCISCGRYAGAVSVGDYIVLAVREEDSPYFFGEARITEVASIAGGEETPDAKVSDSKAGTSSDASGQAAGNTHTASLHSIEGRLDLSRIAFDEDPILRDNGAVRLSEPGLYRLTALERDALLQKLPEEEQRSFSALDLVPFRENDRCSALALGDYRYAGPVVRILNTMLGLAFDHLGPSDEVGPSDEAWRVTDLAALLLDAAIDDREDDPGDERFLLERLQSLDTGDILMEVGKRAGFANLQNLGSTVRGAPSAGFVARVQDAFVTRAMLEVLHDARHVAISASGSELIHTRHLVGAWVRRALHDPTSDEGPLAGLVEMYAGPSGGGPVDHAYLAFLADRYGASNEEDLEAWRAFILNRPPAGKMPPTVLDRVTRDREEDKDHLGRDHEFDAFASLLAARNADPPIAVGLFGDWGAGKSHFIRQLQTRVAAFAEEARRVREAGATVPAADIEPGATPYCAHIIQIDFNAWHYVDANLWASLVDRILEGLDAGLSMHDSTDKPIYRKDAVHDLHAVLQRELKFLQDVERAHGTEVKRLDAEVESARTKVTEVVNDAEVLRDNLRHELARHARIEALGAIKQDLSEVVPALDGAAKSLGYESGKDALDAVADIVADTRGFSGRACAAIAIILNRPREHWAWLTLGAGGLVLAPVLGRLTETLTDSVFGGDLLGNATNSAAFLATMLATALPAIAAFLKKADGALKAFQQADAALGQKEAELEREIASRIGATEAELKTKENALAAAELQLASSQERSTAVRHRLARLSDNERAAFFVSERLAEGTYERHLGLISTIRRDLQRLSELLRDEGKKVPVRRTGRRQKASSSTQVQRIERIILYVDDLDRCPPDRVVEVLQAIRLLLSFPLFVVVVGVDVRWVASALHQRFGDLLALDGPGEGTNPASPAQATAMDYLEKIFQIPFWIAPMSAEDAGRLIRGIVDIETIGEPPYREPSAQPASTGVPSGTGDLISIGTATDDPELAPQESDRGADAAEGLRLYRHELEAMSHLGEIAGRTPRATKRFLNLYRVLKGADSRTGSRRFLGEDGHYRAVLVLLAVVCGRPSLACRFLSALWGETEQLDLASFARTRMINSENDPGWRELGVCLEHAAQSLEVSGIDTNVDRHVTITALKEWLPLAARFSFEKWRPQ